MPQTEVPTCSVPLLTRTTPGAQNRQADDLLCDKHAPGDDDAPEGVCAVAVGADAPTPRGWQPQPQPRTRPLLLLVLPRAGRRQRRVLRRRDPGIQRGLLVEQRGGREGRGRRVRRRCPRLRTRLRRPRFYPRCPCPTAAAGVHCESNLLLPTLLAYSTYDFVVISTGRGPHWGRFLRLALGGSRS